MGIHRLFVYRTIIVYITIKFAFGQSKGTIHNGHYIICSTFSNCIC